MVRPSGASKNISACYLTAVTVLSLVFFLVRVSFPIFLVPIVSRHGFLLRALLFIGSIVLGFSSALCVIFGGLFTELVLAPSWTGKFRESPPTSAHPS